MSEQLPPKPSISHLLKQAREWPLDCPEGRYFHAMADVIERLQTDVANLRIGNHKTILKYVVVDADAYADLVKRADRIVSTPDE